MFGILIDRSSVFGFGGPFMLTPPPPRAPFLLVTVQPAHLDPVIIWPPYETIFLGKTWSTEGHVGA
jgi:hypothetical protein